MQVQPCLYILCGFSFSGKSTLARELVKMCGFQIVDMDAINGERGIGLVEGVRITPEEWDETYREVYRRLERLLRQGHSVVYDSCGFTFEQREVVRSIAERCGALSQVIFVDVPEEVARERLRQNRIARRRFDVRDDDFAHVVDNFQAPTEEENTIRFDGSMTVDEWIRANF